VAYFYFKIYVLQVLTLSTILASYNAVLEGEGAAMQDDTIIYRCVTITFVCVRQLRA
jgi:hypothetical protein